MRRFTIAAALLLAVAAIAIPVALAGGGNSTSADISFSNNATLNAGGSVTLHVTWEGNCGVSDGLERRFDDLAKATAREGHTRRGLLKFTAGLAAAATAASLPARALAGGNGNDVCAHWCTDNFPPGSARAKCT